MTNVFDQIETPLFPAPPAGCSGWPWEADRSFNISYKNKRDLPKISVITPSFGQGKYIEQTIRSVLLQNYPALEYIIIDGNSRDNSVEIISRYDQWLEYWVSKPDRGQSHAINKGFSKATGEIICWLNSDDFFLPNTLSTVCDLLNKFSGNYAIVGHCLRLEENAALPILLEGNFQNRLRLMEFWKGYQMHQPAIFWRREIFEKVGWINEELHLTMDFDYWTRVAKSFQFTTHHEVLSVSNFHSAAKTGDDYQAYHNELRITAAKYWGTKLSSVFWILHGSYLIKVILPAFLTRLKYYIKSFL